MNKLTLGWCTVPEPDFKTKDKSEEIWQSKLPFKESDLKKTEEKYNTPRNAIAIAAGLMALNKYSGKSDVLTNWIYDNRTTKNSMNYVGLMIKTLPVGVHFDKIKSNAHLLEVVKNQVSEGIQNCDYDYFTEYESALNNDCMEVNYVGNIDFNKSKDRLNHEYIELDRNDSIATARLEIEIWPIENDEIQVISFYLANLYKKENINRFMEYYLEAFNKLVKD